MNMKKTTLALAVATALGGLAMPASADTTLYGSARASVNYVDTGPLDSWDVVNQASRLGVRGEEDLGGGMAAIYQYEFGVDLTEGSEGFTGQGNRPKWVGLKGNSWGSLTLGTQWTPYYNVIGVGDIFNDATYTFSSPAYYLGNKYGRRMDNSILYSTPNLSGFSAQLMMVTNGNGGASEAKDTTGLASTGANLLPANLSDGVDMWNVSASYKNGPFFVGATGMWLEGNDLGLTIPAYDGQQWGVAGGYNSGPIAVTLSYEDGDVNNMGYRAETDSWYLTGQYTFGNNVIRAAYGYITPDDGTVKTVSLAAQDSYSNYALGYQYNLSKRTRLWAEYIGRDGVDATKVGPGDLDVLSIGTRVDF